MEPEDSLLHVQVPANYPSHEPDQSSPCPPIPLPQDPSFNARKATSVPVRVRRGNELKIFFHGLLMIQQILGMLMWPLA
jgi:hypothetical protein